jgi:hypothetical protein
MEKFDDLSNLDLIDLSDDDVNRWIDLTCAQEGLPLLPAHPGPEPELETVPKTEVVLQLNIPYDVYFNLSDLDKLEKIISSLNGLARSTSTGVKGTYNEPKYLVPTDQALSTGRESFYTKDEAHKVYDLKKASQDYLDQYTAMKTAYDTAKDERQDTVDRIHEAVQLANEDYAAYLALSKSWDKYLDLADNDYATADKFFLSRYGEVAHRRVRPIFYTATEAPETPEIIKDEF